MKNTLTHSEDNKGWTSFWNYFPDGFLNLNNKFLTIKDGMLIINQFGVIGTIAFCQ